MDEKVIRLFRVFETFTADQKREVLAGLRGYEVRGMWEEGLRKSLNVSMGPLAGKCNYCGK